MRQIWPCIGWSYVELLGTRTTGGIVRRSLHSRTYRTILGLTMCFRKNRNGSRTSQWDGAVQSVGDSCSPEKVGYSRSRPLQVSSVAVGCRGRFPGEEHQKEIPCLPTRGGGLT